MENEHKDERNTNKGKEDEESGRRVQQVGVKGGRGSRR